MTRAALVLAVALLALVGPRALAQERAGGVGGRLLESPDRPVGLGAATDAISRTLDTVEPGKVVDLNRRYDTLRSESAALERMLDDLARGIPITLPQRGQERPYLPTPERLAAEREELERLKGELAVREEERNRELESQQRVDRARRRTRRSEAMLGALAELPKAAPAEEHEETVRSPFPLKTADALYRAGDHRGALRHFRAALEGEGATLDPRHAFAMARCHEELGELQAARDALAPLLGTGEEEGGFWRERAVRLDELIEGKQLIERALNPTKESAR